MKKIRLIARLDVKGTRVVKGIFYEGWRDIGDPSEISDQCYEQGADEILYMDIFASLTRRKPLFDVIRGVAENTYIPLTVGGGIKSIDDINGVLRAGADKVAINTHAIKKPSLIREASRKFGSQCVVVSIEAKRRPCGYEAYVDHGRNITGVDVVEWAKAVEHLGAGEILLSSVDTDGTTKGFDLELLKLVSENVSIPVIAGSGAGTMEHVIQAVKHGADAVATASMLHYKKASISDMKNHIIDNGIAIRM